MLFNSCIAVTVFDSVEEDKDEEEEEEEEEETDPSV
jgi:hypothetical protein